MLKEYEKFRLGKKFFAEVNWRPKDPETNECKVIKFILPDGQIEYLKKEMLLSLLFVIGSPSEQRKMIPQKITTVRNYSRTVKIKAKKDIRKGEEIIVTVPFTLPNIEEEVIGEVSKRYKVPKQAIEKRPSGILIPGK